MKYLCQFPWANTYALGPYTQERPWQPRAAELIAFVGAPGQKHTNSISRSCFNRILLSPEVRLTQQQEEWLSSTGLPYHRPDVFKSASSLLESERLFISNLATYRQADKSCGKRLAAAFRLLASFESRFGGPTSDRFENANIAHGPHGTGHVARVMFWSAFLATYPFGETETNRHTATMLAALLHDIGRQQEWEDQGHGDRSLEKHQHLIEQALDDMKLRESCASAVRMHGTPDEECPVTSRDLTWKLLKDADGLERGRFGRPGNDGRGCNPAMLRLDYILDSAAARKSLPWLAYQLSGITKHSQWSKRPCRRLLTDFFLGMRLGLAHAVFQGQHQAVAEELHQELSTLCDELAMQDWCEEMGDQMAEADAAYAEYVEAEEEEEQLYQEEQEQEWEEWLNSDDDNDWDDHDMDWEDFDWDDD